jgi:F-type H+-transporting ATPase subunit b
MELIKPDLGLIVWMVISFSIVLFILKKFAWKPILGAIKDREDSIEEALLSAEKAKEEMEQLVADNDKIMQEARKERDLLIKEAKEIKDQIISEAKTQANDEANKILDNAKKTIDAEKNAALNEIKNQISSLSIDIAEKIISKKIENQVEYNDIINNAIDGLKLN